MIQLAAMYLILVKNCHVSKKDSSRDGLFGDSSWSWSEDQSQSTPERGRSSGAEQLVHSWWGLSIHSSMAGREERKAYVVGAVTMGSPEVDSVVSCRTSKLGPCGEKDGNG